MKEKEIKEILITQEEIQQIVERLGAELTKKYKNIEEPLVVVGLLRGSFIFMADLVRHIDIPLVVEFMEVSSYGDGTESSGDVKIVMDLNVSIENRHVLIVEDIVDTGRTFAKVVRMLNNRKPYSLATCTLLNKPTARIANVQIDFCGRNIGDEFVVGYGLDYAQLFRNLPFVGCLSS